MKKIFSLICITICMCCSLLTACSPKDEECIHHVSLGWFVTEVPTETMNGKYCDLCCYCGEAIETKEIELIQVNTENIEQYYTLDIEVLDSGRSATLSKKSDLTIVKSDITVGIEINLSGTLYVNVTPNWTESVTLVLMDNDSASQDFSSRWCECSEVKLENYELTSIEGCCWIVVE